MRYIGRSIQRKHICIFHTSPCIVVIILLVVFFLKKNNYKIIKRSQDTHHTAYLLSYISHGY